MVKKLAHTYESIISLDNLLEAWREFVRGKRKRKDVQEFELRLMDNVLALHKDLRDKTYSHSDYEAFNISDPKPRSIHKASVRDRLLHHALYRILYPFFDTTFISGSYSCRKEKGSLLEIAKEIEERYDITFEKIGTDGNHIHILCSYHPKYSGSQIVGMFKSITARELFRRFPELRKKLWGGEFWSDGYYLATVSERGELEDRRTICC